MVVAKAIAPTHSCGLELELGLGLGQVAAKAVVEISLQGKVVAIIAAVASGGDSNRLAAGQWWVRILAFLLWRQ